MKTLLAVAALGVGLLANEVITAQEPRPGTSVPATSGAVNVTGEQGTDAENYSDARYAAPTRIDRIGRIVVPVMVNQRGPYSFIFDTGANTSVLGPRLAHSLGLSLDPEPVTLNGVTGSASVPTAQVARIEAGSAVMEEQHLAIAQATAIGTDGVLGVDTLKDKLVVVDFVHDRIQVLDARDHRPGPRLARIHGSTRFGNLMVVDAVVSGHKVAAVIDTGGQRTLGNRALYAALGLRSSTTLHGESTWVEGATDVRQPGESYVVRDLVLGSEMHVTNLSVIFGDFHIFKLWNLEKVPAIVLGMDMIGTLDTFAVDYLRREVQIRSRI